MASGGPPRLSVVVPTFNEAANVVPLYNKLREALRGLPWEVVFVDDNSPDDTAGQARALSRMDPRVRCIRRIGRRGLASACIEGTLATSSPYVAVIDGDMQHDERLLPRMLAALETGDYDIAVGSRHVDGGGMGDLDRRRVWISDFASGLGRRVLRASLTDPMSGFFMVRRDFFEATAPRLSNEGFKILFDLFASAARPARFVELPYEFRARQHGASKLDAHVALDYAKLLIVKLTRGLIPASFIMFGAVGALGLVVHLTVLGVLNQLGHVGFVYAQLAATCVAMAFNYTLNNMTTYRDRRLRGWRFVTGFLSFAAICLMGVVANVGIAGVLFEKTPIWWLAGAAGAVIGAVWNYAMASTFTWKKG
jgi:dolichol-phosphate mannosyltransferase